MQIKTLLSAPHEPSHLSPKKADKWSLFRFYFGRACVRDLACRSRRFGVTLTNTDHVPSELLVEGNDESVAVGIPEPADGWEAGENM